MAEFLLGIFCGAIITAALACAYVCGDERGFASGTRINWLIREYERMKREAIQPPAGWQDDGM